MMLVSDAYATGQALVALRESGALSQPLAAGATSRTIVRLTSAYACGPKLSVTGEERGKRFLEIDAATATLSANRCEPTLFEFDDDLPGRS